MPVVSGDLKLYKSANTPADDTSAVGGAISATQITNATIGETFRTITSNAAGGANKVMYQKNFIKNTNGSSNLNSATVWMPNSLDATPGGGGTVTVVSDNSADGSQLQAYVIGIDLSNNPNMERITLNGTSSVTGLVTWTTVWKVIIQATVGQADTPLTGNVTVSVAGTTIGVIPANYFSGTAEIKIGLTSTLNDSSSSTNDLTAPAGISFTKPRTQATGISVANAGSLTNGSGQGVWIQETIPAGLATSTEVEIGLAIGGNSS